MHVHKVELFTQETPSHAGKTTHVSLQFIILTGQAVQTRCSCARSADMKHDQTRAAQRNGKRAKQGLGHHGLQQV